MNITDKIEEIRQKPEHIRLRYVWFFVAISMIFVLIIWAISWKITPPENQPAASEDDLLKSEIIDKFGQQKELLKDAQQKSQDAFSELGKSVPEDTSINDEKNQ